MRSRLGLDGDWSRRWSGSWLIGEGLVAWPIRDMAAVPFGSAKPVRRFTWRARQGHRPGLLFMVSTGRHHGFESLEEMRLLLALDFLAVVDVLAQPFELDFEYTAGRGRHTPDFLAVLPGGVWLFDVRPGDRIEESDALKFAAAAETAAVCGWRYSVVTGWRPHVWSGVDHLSSQRRSLHDQVGLAPELMAAARQGPTSFGDLAAATRLPVVARAHAVHLLWHRRLGMDFGTPLTDASLVWAAADARARE